MPGDVVQAIDADGVEPSRRIWAVLSVSLAIVLTALDSSIANVALPAIAKSLGARPADSIWIVNAYQLAIVATLLPFASLGEIVGFRRVYQAGVAFFTLSSLVCALSTSLPELTIARAVQGLGASAIMSVNAGLLRFTFPARMLGRALGINAITVSVSLAIGPSVASAVLAVGPWPWLFAINLPLGLLALLLALRALPTNPLSKRGFDTVSAALNAAAFGLIVVGVDLVTRTAAKALGGVQLLAGTLAAALLVRREWNRPAPLAPFDLLRKPLFALSVLASVVSFTAQGLAFVSLPFHFENSLHLSQVTTGLLMTPWPAAVAVAAPVSGWLADRVSSLALTLCGLLILAAGLVGLFMAADTANELVIGSCMAICGVGFGFFQPPNNRLLIASAPRDRSGAAGGMLGTARLTGQTIGAGLTAILMGLMGRGGETWSIGLAAAFAAAAAFTSLIRWRRGDR